MAAESHIQERACPVCESREFAEFAEENFDPEKFTNLTYASRKTPEFMCLRLVKCRVCDLVYAPSPPKNSILIQSYEDAGFNSGTEARSAAKSYAKALSRHEHILQKKTYALEIGAGSGPFLSQLKKIGYEKVIGIEPSVAAVEAAEPEVQDHLRLAFFEPALIANNSVSLMCSFMTLEHISDPFELVQSSFHKLEDEGVICLVTHDWRGFVNRILGLKSPIIDVEHLQLFNKNSLHHMLNRAGFSAIDIRGFTNTYPLSYWTKLLPLPEVLRNGVLKTLNILRMANIPIPFRVGNIFAVAIKRQEAENGPSI